MYYNMYVLQYVILRYIQYKSVPDSALCMLSRHTALTPSRRPRVIIANCRGQGWGNVVIDKFNT